MDIRGRVFSNVAIFILFACLIYFVNNKILNAIVMFIFIFFLITNISFRRDHPSCHKYKCIFATFLFQ